MNAQMQKIIMGGLWMIAVALCVANVWVFRWQPKTPVPSEAEQRQTRLAAAHQAGVAEARQDIRNGVLALKSAGLPTAWSEEYRQMLRTRYNIGEGFGLGCTGSEEEFALIHSYNRTMRAEIERRYGKGVLEQAAKDAETAFKTKHAMAEQSDGANRVPR